MVKNYVESGTTWSARRVSTLNRSVALGGFMGSGKSEVGALLANKLSLPFVDMDSRLTDQFGPIATQFELEGEGVFREREQAFLTGLSTERRFVLSTGGGVWVNPHCRAALKDQFICVVLLVSWPELVGRISNGDGRPLWADSVSSLFER